MTNPDRTKRLLGITCIIFPFVLFLILGFNNIEFPWYFSERRRLYDLVYSIFNFYIFTAGIVLFVKKDKASTVIFFLTLFIVYQVFSWHAQYKKVSATLSLDGGDYLLLVPYGAGAFTSTNWVNLELFENYAVFFKVRRIEAYHEIRSGRLSVLDNDTIKIDLETYDSENIITSINIDQLKSKK